MNENYRSGAQSAVVSQQQWSAFLFITTAEHIRQNIENWGEFFSTLFLRPDFA